MCSSNGVASRINAGPRDVEAGPRSPGGDGEAAPLPHGGNTAKGRVSGDRSGGSAAIGKGVQDPVNWLRHWKKRVVPVTDETEPVSGPG